MIYILLAYFAGILTVEIGLPIIEAVAEILLTLKEWLITFIATKIYKLKQLCEEDDEEINTNAIGFVCSSPDDTEEEDEADE